MSWLLYATKKVPWFKVSTHISHVYQTLESGNLGCMASQPQPHLRVQYMASTRNTCFSQVLCCQFHGGYTRNNPILDKSYFRIQKPFVYCSHTCWTLTLYWRFLDVISKSVPIGLRELMKYIKDKEYFHKRKFSSIQDDLD